MKRMTVMVAGLADGAETSVKLFGCEQITF
jgi:hypothetical protein